MTLHLVALPHTQLTSAYSACAYTMKAKRWIPMMQDQGFEVALHGQLTIEEQALFGFHGPQDYLGISFDASEPIWQVANSRAARSIREQWQPGDVVCLTGGNAQQPLVGIGTTVEPFVGYKGTCRGTFRVFESHAWRNFVYGRNDEDGQFFDEVIPNFYDLRDFPIVTEPDDYFAFVGRLDANKGLEIAQQVCESLGAELRVAGLGEPRGYGEFLGMMGQPEIAKLLGHARATFVPTRYVGPFEGVHVESMLCGTPVLTTDFGVFTETVENGLDGFRCSMFREFREAATKTFDRARIAARARRRFSTKTVGAQFADYFDRIATLSKDGWYQK